MSQSNPPGKCVFGYSIGNRFNGYEDGAQSAFKNSFQHRNQTCTCMAAAGRASSAGDLIEAKARNTDRKSKAA
jgi:hypothetical protein